MTERTEAQRLAAWMKSNVCIYPQTSEDEPGGYATEFDQVADEAAAELLRLESEVQEQCRINGMGAERELALMAKVDRLDAEVQRLTEQLASVSNPARCNCCGYKVTDREHLGCLRVARAALSGTAPARKPLTDEQAKELLKRSDLLDMFLHIGWYSAPRKGFDEHALALIRAIEAAHGITGDAA